MITGNFDFTLSKLLGYLIFIAGVVYAFIFHDSTVIISMTGIGAGLLGLKNWSDTQISKHNRDMEIGKGKIPTPIVEPDKNDIG